MITAQFFFTPTVRAYLSEALTTDQQMWLSDEVVRRPLSIAEFMLSKDGMSAVSGLMRDFEAYVKKSKAEQAPKSSPFRAS